MLLVNWFVVGQELHISICSLASSLQQCVQTIESKFFSCNRIASLESLASKTAFITLPYDITIVQDDILKQDVQVIVNAANCGLKGGGGIDGAIHANSKNDAKMIEETQNAQKASGKNCETGFAYISNSYFPLGSKIKYVIHTVGPNCAEGKTYGVEEGGFYKKDSHSKYQMNDMAKMHLYDAYLNSLELASNNNFSSLAFCFISSAIFACDNDEACRIALDAACYFGATHPKTSLKIVLFVCFSAGDYSLFKNKLPSVKQARGIR